MAQHSNINGTAVTVTLVGAVLLYSAVKNRGITDTLHSLLQGKPIDPAVAGAGPFAPSVVGEGGVTGAFVPGGSVQTELMNSLLKGGFTLAQTAGILANAQYESGFSPTASGDGGSAIGLFQWEGGRRTALRAWASAHGLTETDVKAQIGYMWAELNSGYAHVQLLVRAQTDPATVARIWDVGPLGVNSGTGYENSAGTTTTQRENAARSIYRQLKAAH